jgi:hypothetical protein
MGIINLLDQRQVEMFDAFIAKDQYAFLQQSSAWARIASTISNDKILLFFIEGKDFAITATMYLFKSIYGNFLVSNAQAGSIGCFTFIGDPKKRNKAYRKLIEEITNYALKNECITITVTSNPYSDDYNLINEGLMPDAGMKTFISYIDILKYFDENGKIIYKDYNIRSNLSRNIKKSYLTGFEFKIDNSIDTLNKWYNEIHCRRITELGGKALPWQLFHNIYLENEIQSNYQFFTVKKNNKLISGDLCIYNNVGNLDNFMMSTDSDYLKDRVNYFIIDNILKWCYKNKIVRYNWQSSNPPGGGIFNFKKSWGSIVAEYYYYTKIIDKSGFSNMINSHPFNEIMNNVNGHFIAPFHTIKTGTLGVLSKDEINVIANIYQNK